MEEFTTVKNPKGKSDIWRHFGDILCAQRSQLKPKHVDTLIFLKKNIL